MLAPILALIILAAPPPAVVRFSPRPNRAAEIHWRGWSAEALEEARRTGKPIFLNLAAVWCHWCHVFDETTLSNPEVIALLNEQFVPIRVDADQNPTVERRYLMGGWPTNAFLEGSGEPLGGGTYFPPDRFLLIARAVSEGYAGDHQELRHRLGDMDLQPREDIRPGAVPADLAVRLGAELREALDAEHGGWGFGPKFPQGDALALLAYLGRSRHDPAAGRAATFTLQQMARGEITDPVEGGVYRYALRADWSAPHYEKMLATEAEVLLAASETYAATHDEAVRGLGMSIASYLARTLWDEQAGACWASQDADEEYAHRDATGRRALHAPYIDRTFLADREALAARAFFRAATTFGEPELARYGQRIVDLLLTRMLAPSGLLFHTLSAAPGSHPSLEAPLLDQAQGLLALLDAAAWTGEARYQDAAASLERVIEREYADSHAAGLFDVSERSLGPGLTATREKPFVANALAAWGMLRLADSTGDEALRQRGAALLAAFAGRAQGLEAVTLARAAEVSAGQTVRVAVVGPPGPASQALFEAAHHLDDPRVELHRPPLARDGSATLGADRFPPGPAAVYVCAHRACSSPLRDAATLPAAVDAFIQAHAAP